MLAVGVIAANAAGNSLLRVDLSSEAAIGKISLLTFFTHLSSIAVILGGLILLSGFIMQLSLLSWADLTFAVPITSASMAQWRWWARWACTNTFPRRIGAG